MRVITIVADTFRRDHLGCYGNKWIRTPNLDALADVSTVFDQAYIGSFPTVPNRRDTFLGHGDKGVPFNRWRTIDADEVTLGERLAEKDIHSFMLTDVQNNVTRSINLYKGFSGWYCNRGQEADPFWTDAEVPLEWPVPPELIRYTEKTWHQILVTRAHRKVETDWFAPGTYRLACEWLERNYKRRDFWLYVDTFDPHEPWDPPEWYEKMYDPNFRGRRFDAPTYGLVKRLGITRREKQNIRARYAGEISMVDAGVGRLVTSLQKLGIWDDTLLIFTSDHGTCFDYPGDHGMLCKANMLGDDGMIMSAGRPPVKPLHYYPHWTGVCRIPLIVHMPGQKRTQRIKAITQPWDLAPTVLDAFGMKRAPELWGESLLELATGKAKKIRDAAVLGNQIHTQVMTQKWMYATWRGQRDPLLYDMRTDPEQKRNVYAKHPKVVSLLHKHVARHLERQGLDGILDEYV